MKQGHKCICRLADYESFLVVLCTSTSKTSKKVWQEHANTFAGWQIGRHPSRNDAYRSAWAQWWCTAVVAAWLLRRKKECADDVVCKDEPPHHGRSFQVLEAPADQQLSRINTLWSSHTPRPPGLVWNFRGIPLSLSLTCAKKDMQTYRNMQKGSNHTSKSRDDHAYAEISMYIYVMFPVMQVLT